MESLWDIIKKQQESSAQKPFSSHFDNQNLKFSELLSDERIVSSFQNQNPQLLKYINQHPAVFDQMIDYITIEPKEQDSKDRKHRYPFISGQILSIQNSLIYEAFFGIEDDSDPQQKTVGQEFRLVKRLLGYANEELNPLLVGYCQKVFNNLFQGNRVKLLRYWFDNFSKKYVSLLSNMNICNIVKKIITLPDEQGQQLFSTQRQQLLQQVLQSFSIQNEQYRANTIDIFRQIFSRYLLIANGKQLLHLILNSSSSYLKEGQQIQQHTLSFVRDLLIKVNFRSKEQQQQNVINLPQQFIQNLNISILNSLQKHHQPQTEQYLNQSRTKVTNLGKLRMFLIQTIREIIKINTVAHNSKLIENNLLEWLFNLVQEFKFNSILHCAVQKILIFLLQTDLKKQIIEEHNLIDRLCCLLENNQNSLAFGQLCNIFFVLYNNEDQLIQQKMKESRVVGVYQYVVLPRKQKYEFKWSGSLTNYKSKPLNFVDQQPGSTTSEQQIKKQQNKPKKNDFDFDFSGVTTKTPNTFNPFTTFPGKTTQNKAKATDFNFF